MNGVLCEAFFAERGVDIAILYSFLSNEGKDLYNATSAVICNICIEVTEEFLQSPGGLGAYF